MLNICTPLLDSINFYDPVKVSGIKLDFIADHKEQFVFDLRFGKMWYLANKDGYDFHAAIGNNTGYRGISFKEENGGYHYFDLPANKVSVRALQDKIRKLYGVDYCQKVNEWDTKFLYQYCSIDITEFVSEYYQVLFPGGMVSVEDFDKDSWRFRQLSGRSNCNGYVTNTIGDFPYGIYGVFNPYDTKSGSSWYQVQFNYKWGKGLYKIYYILYNLTRPVNNVNFTPKKGVKYA